MQQLKKIIDEIKSWKEYNFSDDHILECATRIFNSGNIEKKKTSTSATDKQKAKMNQLNIKFPDSITKLEASKLIDERLKEINKDKRTNGSNPNY